MPSLTEFLIDRLVSNNIRHIWNYPGDYTLQFCKQVEKSKISLIGTTSEECAGFAADAYARINGLGAVCVTYCVGGFKALNAIAGAYEEHSPVLVIAGSPGIKERQPDVRLHHMVRDFDCQRRIYEEVTCANTVLSDPSKAAYEIDRVIEAAKQYKQPAYIEIPRDMVNKAISYNVYTVGTPSVEHSDKEALGEAIAEVKEWICKAERPIIWAGVELARYGLGQKLLHFAEENNIPIATDILGKSVVNEKHPLCLGVYNESTGRPDVTEVFAKSDCVIILGVLMTDMNLGFVPLRWSKKQVINASSYGINVKNHTFNHVQFADFVEALCSARIRNKASCVTIAAGKPSKFNAVNGAKLTAARLMEKVNSILDENMIVCADTGDSLFGALDMTVHKHNRFIASAYYTTMGFAVPAALGVQLADPSMRPIVLVGDGAFQMTGQEFSTLVRLGLNPIIIILNNGGYATERLLMPGNFNNIQAWNFEKMPELVNGGIGFKAETEDHLDYALNQALRCREPAIINAVISDYTPAVNRMTARLAKRV